MTEILRCPFCAAELSKNGGSYYCSGERKHCFDIAKSGYVTLTRASGTSGDDKDMVRARSEFLDGGYYKPFADKIAELCNGAETVLDAGCGEGYYSNMIASRGHKVYGFDLSKHACDKAAKRSKAGGTSAFFGVAGIFELPVADGSVDAAVSLFAPIAEKEFSRILKDDGILIVGAAGKRHLYELKSAVYDTAYENEGRRDLPAGFELAASHNVKYSFVCPSEHLKSLFMMTPYAFKTSQKDAARLSDYSELTITADFDIFVYKKSIL